MAFQLELFTIYCIWLASCVRLTTCHPLVPLSYGSYGVLGDPVLGNLTRRQLSSCYPLDLEGAQKLPKWGDVKNYIKESFDKDYDAILVNDIEYPDRSAYACMESGTLPVQWANPPNCTPKKNTLVGTVDGTNQTTTFAEIVGTIQKTVWTVVRETSLSRGFDVAVTLEFPAIAKVETHMMFSGMVRNEQARTFDTTFSNLHEARYMFQNPDGKRCTFQHETTTCTTSALSKVPMVAQGWLFIRFKKPVALKSDPNGSKHFHWFINIESILKDPKDRTDYIEISGPFSIEQFSKSKTVCVEFDEDDEEEEEEEEEEEALQPL